jgi:hypothetical protein
MASGVPDDQGVVVQGCGNQATVRDRDREIALT